MNRERRKRGTRQHARDEPGQSRLDERRADMQAAEGHAGSIPRGNQQPEQENVVHRRHEWDRLLGH